MKNKFERIVKEIVANKRLSMDYEMSNFEERREMICDCFYTFYKNLEKYENSNENDLIDFKRAAINYDPKFEKYFKVREAFPKKRGPYRQYDWDDETKSFRVHLDD